MARFQPLLPLTTPHKKTGRRSGGRPSAWQALGVIVLLFLGLTLIAVRYLPVVETQLGQVLNNNGYKDVFVPPIPKPPLFWGPAPNHNHSLHLIDERDRLRHLIEEAKERHAPLPPPPNFHEQQKSSTTTLPSSLSLLLDPLTFNETEETGSSLPPIPPQNLTALFATLSIEQLEHIRSPRIRREKVREMIYHAYSHYERHAWGANEYRPISKVSHSANIFGSHPLGIMIIDSLDTLHIADLKELYQKSRDWIETTFEPKVASEVSVFEINIRLVGGLLSAYALTNDKMYLDKALRVADLLLPAFNTPTSIPHALIVMTTGASKNWNWAQGGCSILSELGTIHLEFQYLSQLSGKPSYLELVEKLRTTLEKANENNLYYNYINPQTGKWCQKHASLGALGDSFYEYLLKSWLLSGKKDERARLMYENAMKAAEEAMLRKTATSNLYYFGEQRSGRLDSQMGHLTCFVGGLYSLAATTLSNTTAHKEHQMDIAQGIAHTCHESYIRTDTHLGPEAFHFERADVEARSLRENEKYYILRPEAIETWFYLWRSTKKQIYRDWAWDAIISLERHSRVDGGYSGIRDVYKVPAQHDDVQQSFFLAETLKYLYLIYTNDSVISLDQFVFNTEAHPFRIRNQ